VITPFAVLVLAAETRREMEDWVTALKSVASKEQSFDHQSAQEHYRSTTSGDHAWYVCSHGRPTHCNACRENLSGVAWHGLSCEVCKIKSHKRCATKISESCKWTTLDSIPPELRSDDEESSLMPHQWLEGNLPMGSRCGGCEKACGSVLKLQDWRCLWCNMTVHDQCRDSVSNVCQLGTARLSVLPPVALKCLTPDSAAELRWSALGTSLAGGSPLLVLVNSKSGDNHGLRVLRKFKRLLNPAQVFDIMSGGPDFALNFFKKFDSFRVLVCGGDGTVGWVLSALDRLELHSKCQLGVLPLGTGNDLARVLGWGHAFEDDTQLPHLLETFEQSHSKMLDRYKMSNYCADLQKID
uniref:diacylglycerol kinase (ATP) n=1 Tax=Plectus sambesii TaxID=2011161 RepID=A0A914XE15_9BILA